MKIFNWMRRRFTDERDKSVEKVKLEDDQIFGINNQNDNHKQSLLNDDDDQFDDQWRGGLLTIGTFGIDPHKHYLNNQPNEYCKNYYNMVVKEEENDELEEGEIMMSINDFCDDQSEALIKITKNMDGDDDIIDQSDHEIMVEKKERITLADLFNAESAEMLEKPSRKENIAHDQFIMCKKKTTATPPPPPPPKLPEQLKKKKKHMSPTSVKQFSQPIQKLVKRMLKRKIHPELEGRTKSCAGVTSTKRDLGLGAHDTISLLQTPGINSEVGA